MTLSPDTQAVVYRPGRERGPLDSLAPVKSGSLSDIFAWLGTMSREERKGLFVALRGDLFDEESGGFGTPLYPGAEAGKI